MNPQINHYLAEGCGRCKLGGTPDCKVHLWPVELRELRRIVLDCGLEEELKWGVPCYTCKGANVIIVSAFKEYASLSFFKGALLADEHQILVKPGDHTQAARIIKFTNSSDVITLEPVLRAYIYEAIEVEKKGLKVETKPEDEFLYPNELIEVFKNNQQLQSAFEALTPGRKRGYLMHFSQAKQSQTRIARIEKVTPLIMEGKGLQGK